MHLLKLALLEYDLRFDVFAYRSKQTIINLHHYRIGRWEKQK